MYKNNKSVAQRIVSKIESGETVNALIYARTSTLKDEQKDSCDNQIAMGNIYLRNHPNIKLVHEPFIDKGISGKSNLHRESFQNMLYRIMKGEIDLIIVKTKARLCRSKAIASKLDEMMRDYNFSILTLSDGQIYDSSDRSSRLINGIRDIIDEDYVWAQSEYGKMAHQVRCEKRILTSNNVTYGFKWNKETKDIEINEEEAKIKAMIFEWYVYQNMGVNEISKRLGDMGIYGKNSDKLVNPRTITQWLTDTTAIGEFYINKRGSTLDIGENRQTTRFENPKGEWILVDRPDLAFLNKDLFDMAQKIREERRETYDKPSKKSSQARFKGFHMFASKIFCGSCGTQMVHAYSDRAETISIYKDYFVKKAKQPGEKCDNKNYNKIHEATLESITKKAINLTLENRQDIFDNLLDIINESIQESSNETTSTENNKKHLKKLEKEKTSYFESWRTAPDNEMKDYFYKQIEELNVKIEKVKKEIDAFDTKTDSADKIKQQLENIKVKLDELKQIEKLDRNIVDNFVDKIVIHQDGSLFITLKIGARYKTVIQSYKEVATSLKNGEVAKYIKRIKDIIFFWENVGRMCITGTMDHFLQAMRIAQKIC